MITIAIDAATDRLSVALATDTATATERHVVGARRHAAQLIPMLDALLKASGLTGPASVERVIVADGPGSFTGLRVAAAAAKALVHAGGVELLAIPSLLGRAWRAAGADAGLVLAASSALRGEVYAGWYRLEGGGASVVHAAVPMSAAAVVAGPKPDHLVGDGPAGLLEALAERWQVPLLGGEAAAADARALLELARHPAGAAWRVADPAAWEPVYGRPAEAQARWEREHGRPLPDSTSGRG